MKNYLINTIDFVFSKIVSQKNDFEIFLIYVDL